MIRFVQSGPVAQLTLDRDGARNALPTAQWLALAAKVSEIADSNAQVVMLTSAMPGIFSAGADLAEFRELVEDPARRSAFREAMGEAIEAMAALPMPVIAAIDGGCFGAAVALTLACDIVIAGDDAVFATTPAKLGLSYPAGDVARLRARVGQGHAALMLFTGDRLDADTALARGLVHLRAPHAETAARDLAATIAANVPDAIAKLKHVLNCPEAPGHETAFDDAFGSPAFAQRLDAFLGGAR